MIGSFLGVYGLKKKQKLSQKK